ncbi:MAG: hypothetical protein NVS2B12_36690 [Ktedonobacteraceae bacterium]
MMPDPEVIVAGHICLDIFPVFNGQTSASGVISPGKLVKVGPALIAIGGSVANTGLTLHRLGITARLMGKVCLSFARYFHALQCQIAELINAYFLCASS